MKFLYKHRLVPGSDPGPRWRGISLLHIIRGVVGEIGALGLHSDFFRPRSPRSRRVLGALTLPVTQITPIGES